MKFKFCFVIISFSFFFLLSACGEKSDNAEKKTVPADVKVAKTTTPDEIKGEVSSELKETKIKKLSSSELEQWKTWGFTEEEAQKWASANVTISEVSVWKTVFPDIDTVIKWKSLGVEFPQEAREWHKAGYTPVEAAPWIELKLTQQTAGLMIEKSLTVEDAKEWVNAGFTSGDILKWIRWGYNPEQAQSYIATGLDYGDFKSVAVYWMRAFTKAEVPYDAQKIKELSAAGVSPENENVIQALALGTETDVKISTHDLYYFKSKGFSIDEAKEVTLAGFSSSEAVNWRQKGYSIEEMKMYTSLGFSHTSGWHKAESWKDTGLALSELETLIPLYSRRNSSDSKPIISPPPKELLNLIASGMSSNQIAEWKTSISDETVIAEFKKRNIDLSSAKEWMNINGLSTKDIFALIDAKVTRETTSKWIPEHFSASEIITSNSNGITLTQAKRSRAEKEAAAKKAETSATIMTAKRDEKLIFSFADISLGTGKKDTLRALKTSVLFSVGNELQCQNVEIGTYFRDFIKSEDIKRQIDAHHKLDECKVASNGKNKTINGLVAYFDEKDRLLYYILELDNSTEGKSAVFLKGLVSKYSEPHEFSKPGNGATLNWSDKGATIVNDGKVTTVIPGTVSASIYEASLIQEDSIASNISATAQTAKQRIFAEAQWFGHGQRLEYRSMCTGYHGGYCRYPDEFSFNIYFIYENGIDEMISETQNILNAENLKTKESAGKALDMFK